MKRILLVEDEVAIGKLVKMNLGFHSYEIDWVTDGKQALAKYGDAHYDLIILDLMLPLIHGLDVLAAIRVKDSEIPIIITSAKDTSTDRIKGLKLGADDYLIKPFEIEELILRVQKLLERSGSETTDVHLNEFTFGDCYVNFKTFRAKKGSQEFNLKPKEVMLMKFLISRRNEVVPRHEILHKVWGYDVFPSTRTIDNFITNLRKKFETTPKKPEFLISVRGVGYKFQFV